MVFSFLAIAFFCFWGFSHVKAKGISLTPSGLWSLGFGDINQNTMAFMDGEVNNVIALSVIANIPQLFLSLIYVMVCTNATTT